MGPSTSPPAAAAALLIPVLGGIGLWGTALFLLATGGIAAFAQTQPSELSNSANAAERSARRASGKSRPEAAQTDTRKQEAMQLHPLPASEAPIDLRTAVERAIANNNQVLQAREKLNQDNYDKGVVRSLLFPTVGFNFTAGEYKAAVGPTGVAASFGGNRYNQYVADLKATQPLLQFGALSAIHVADYNRRVHELDLEIAVRTLTNNVIQSFYQVLLNLRLVHNLEKILKVMLESEATAQKRLHTGRGQLLDLLQIKTQIALLEPQIETAHNNLEAAGAQLATYLSENGKYYLQLRGTLKVLHLKDVKRFIEPEKARLPELIQVRLKREQIQEQKWVTMGPHLPSLNLVGDYGAISYTNRGLFSAGANNWDILLQLSIPIFSGLQSSYQQQSLNSQDRQLELSGRDLENTLALRQVQSLKSLETSEASLDSSVRAASLADQAMAEANRSYRLATIDFMQFLTVEQSMLQAYSNLDNIEYNNIVAFTNYFVATGQDLNILVDILDGRKK